MSAGADNWLAILNGDGGRGLVYGPDRVYTLAQLRARISDLRLAVERHRRAQWILYEPDAFGFLCGLFALLSLGLRILVPSSDKRILADFAGERDVALMASDGTLPGHIDRDRVDIDLSRGWTPGLSGEGAELKPPANWGTLTLCTSGSSGQPRQITKSADQLYREAETISRGWSLAPNTLFLSLVTHHHMYGLIFALLLPLLARGGIYQPRGRGLLSVLDPVRLPSGRRPAGMAVIASPTVGRQAQRISLLAKSGSAARPDRPLPVSTVVSAGGYLSESNAESIAGLFDCPVTEVFGSTETGAVATRKRGGQPGDGGHWRLLPGLQARTAPARPPADQPDHEPRQQSQAAPVRAPAGSGRGELGELLVWGGHTGGSSDDPLSTGDEVRFVDASRFELLGRCDQIRKIEGKRVSLVEYTEQLESCELVEEAVVLPYQSNNKETLLCGALLSEAGLSHYRQKGKSATSQRIRSHLLRLFDPVLLPRAIRYLDQSPRGDLGKIPRQELVDRLANPGHPEMPLIEETRREGGDISFSLRIPMELVYLRGHFDSRPIVPGFVLLHWAYRFIEESRGRLASSAAVNLLKFHAPVLPGARVSLTLSWHKDGIVFLYEGEHGRKLASGRIPQRGDA